MYRQGNAGIRYGGLKTGRAGWTILHACMEAVFEGGLLLVTQMRDEVERGLRGVEMYYCLVYCIVLTVLY
jgi:hypothetical protein